MISVVYNYQKHIDSSKVRFDYVCFKKTSDSIQSDVEQMGSRVWYVKPGRELCDFFSNHSGAFDIVHCHPIFASELVGRTAKKHGAKAVIAHSHSTRYSDKKLSAIRNRLISCFVGFCATDYIACSEAAKVLLRSHGQSAYVMHNAIDPESFSFSAEGRKTVRDELALTDKTLLLGSVGRCEKQKNQLFLLDVAESLRELRTEFTMAIVGEGPLRRSLATEIDKRGLGTSVRLLGSRNDMTNLYSAFDCFVLPSLFEGLPVSAVEAQATGLPCMLSNRITREVAFGNAVFLPLEGGPDMWAYKAVEICGERRAAAEGLLAASGFDISEEADKLVAFYQEIEAR